MDEINNELKNNNSVMQNVSNIKIPPHSIEAEQAVLGALMIRNSAWDEISDEIIEDCFYRKDHKLIFKAISSLAEKDRPFDVVVLAEYFNSRNQLSKIGNVSYLGTLAKDTPSSSNIRAYAKILYQKYLLRRVIEISINTADEAFFATDHVASDIVDTAQQRIFMLSQNAKKSGPVKIDFYLKNAVEQMEIRFRAKGQLTGLGTGVQGLDAKTSGLSSGDCIVLAGRPSMGKTALSMNIVENVVFRQNKSVLVFSMEMSATQLIDRMASSIGDIPFYKIRSGNLLDEEWPKYTNTIKRLNDAKLYIDDSAGLNLTKIRSRARQFKSKYDIDLIMIDFLQLMKINTINKNMMMTHIIGENIRGIKELAKELNIPIICLSQLNRSLESRQNKRPLMSDLRESGEIEQVADLILFLYRDEIYDKETSFINIAELIISKHRNGPLGTIYLSSELEKMRFSDFKGNLPQINPSSISKNGYYE